MSAAPTPADEPQPLAPPRTTLQARGLTKSYGRRVVVRHVNLEIHTGEVVGLLGPNGAGKTTTFYMVVGLARPDDGQVFLGTEDITHLPMYLRARAGIGYLPQEASVFRKLTAEENVMAILETLGLSVAEQRVLHHLLLQHLGQLQCRQGQELDGLLEGRREDEPLGEALREAQLLLKGHASASGGSGGDVWRWSSLGSWS